MKKLLKNRVIRQLVVLALLLLMVTWTATVSATTPTTPTIDGTIGADWDANENLGPSGPTGSGNPQLWLTWDDTNLYIGVQGVSANTGFQIFFDVASGGATQDTNGNYTIATAGGYERAWRGRLDNSTQLLQAAWFTFAAGTWGTGVPASSAGISSGVSTDLELAIPWTALGLAQPPAANTRLGVLATIGPNLAGSVTNYWPNVSGNTNSPSPSFGQQFIFEEAGASDVVTGSSPTAVSLQSFSANSANHWLAFSGLLILLGGSGLALLRRRQPRA